MMRFHNLFVRLFFVLSLTYAGCTDQPATPSSRVAGSGIEGLVSRVAPELAGRISFELVNSSDDSEWFTVVKREGDLIIQATTKVSLAAGFKHYVESTIGGSLDLAYPSLVVPETLPDPDETTVTARYGTRIYPDLDAATAETLWWRWEQWEPYLDWLALNGVNRPVLATGTEVVWRDMLIEAGMPEQLALATIAGPAYLPAQWQGRLGKLGGPMPPHWVSEKRSLRDQVLSRARELGMIPVVPGFTGGFDRQVIDFFAADTTTVFTGSPILRPVHFLEPAEELFTEMADSYYNNVRSYAGDSVAFWMDTRSAAIAFGESDSTVTVNTALEGVIRTRFPDSEIIFISGGDEENRNKQLVLMTSDGSKPALTITDPYSGTTSLGGNFETLGSKITSSSDFQNIWFESAGSSYNSMLAAWSFDLVWDTTPLDPAEWMSDYVSRRYSTTNPAVSEAWLEIGSVLFAQDAPLRSTILAAPDLQNLRSVPLVTMSRPADLSRFADGVAKLLAVEQEFSDNPAYIFDLSQLTKELIDRASGLHATNLVAAYDANNWQNYRAEMGIVKANLAYLDQISAMHEKFLLGPWLDDAERSIGDPAELPQTRWNALSALSFWHPAMRPGKSDLFYRHWQGMVSSYYSVRWNKFTEYLTEAIQSGKPVDQNAMERDVIQYVTSWPQFEQTYTSSVMTSKPIPFLKIQIDLNKSYLNRLVSG